VSLQDSLRRLWPVAIAFFVLSTFRIPSAGGEAVPSDAPATRTIRFPDEASVGTVNIKPWDADPDTPFWQSLGEARGAVRIPAGSQVQLESGPPNQLWHAALERLGPNDVQSLHAHPPTSADLACLTRWTSLRQLEIVALNADPATSPAFDLATLSAIPPLRRLHLDGSLDDRALESLRGMPALEHVQARGAFTDAGLVALSRLRALRGIHLTFMYVEPTPTLQSEGMRSLAQLPNLRLLWLDQAPLAEPAGAEFERFPALEDVRLEFMRVTSATLAHLRAIPSLRRLHLMAVAVGAPELNEIGRFSQLTDLTIYGPRGVGSGPVSLDGLTALQRLDLHVPSLDSRAALTAVRLPSLREARIDAAFSGPALESLSESPLRKLDLSLVDLSPPGRISGAAFEELTLGIRNIEGGRLALENMPRLRRLVLRNNSLRDGKLRLDRLPALEELILGGSRVGDETVAQLKFHTGLKVLDLSATEITDQALAHAATMPALEDLRLATTRISDAGLASLAQMRSLRRLDLSLTLITDQGIARLKAAPSLESLTIPFTKVTAAAQPDLAAMPRLKHVQASVAALGPPGVARPDRSPLEPTSTFTLIRNSPFAQPAWERPLSDWSLDDPFNLHRVVQLLGARVVEKGLVQPGDFSPGKGLHLTVQAPARAYAPSATIHIWIMEPAYSERPLTRAIADPSTAEIALYGGRLGPQRVFWRCDPAQPRNPDWYLDGSSRFNPIGSNYWMAPAHVPRPPELQRMAAALAGSDLRMKIEALDELYLVAARSEGWLVAKSLDGAFEKALETADEATWRHINQLYTKADIQWWFGTLSLWRSRAETMPIPGIFPDMISERPDLSDLVYWQLLKLCGEDESSVKLGLRLLGEMSLPSTETLRAAFRSSARLLQEAAVLQIERFDPPGYSGEVAPLAGVYEDEVRGAAHVYIMRQRDETVLPGLLRAMRENKDPECTWLFRLLHCDPKGSSESGTWFFSRTPAPAVGFSQWIESGYPWRGNLEHFCALPFGRDARTHLVELMNTRQEEILRWERNLRRVLALNLLLRHPAPEALPALLEALSWGPDVPEDDATSLTRQSATMYRMLAFNPANLPCFYAAQAIIRLGPDAARPVLEHAKKQFALHGRKPARTYGDGDFTLPRPEDFVLCLYILGALGQPDVYKDFARFGAQLKGTRFKADWAIADGWYRTGGKAFHLPRAPLPPNRAGARNLPARNLPLPRFFGSILVRDATARRTIDWDYAQGTISQGLEAKLVIRPGPPSRLQQWLNEKTAKTSYEYKIDYRSIAPDLRPLAVFKSNDLQALDFSGLKIGDGALKQIRHLTGLRELTLRGTGVFGYGLTYLAPMKSLDFLDLSQTPLKDATLKYLTSFPSLRVLDLGETPLTDAAVPRLKPLKSLRVLVINDTRVSRRGFQELQRALPQCEIWK